MTLRELADAVQGLISAGFGEASVIKASDDEGNDFLQVGTIQHDKASPQCRGRYEVKAGEDYDSYDDLVDVICVW